MQIAKANVLALLACIGLSSILALAGLHAAAECYDEDWREIYTAQYFVEVPLLTLLCANYLGMAIWAWRYLRTWWARVPFFLWLPLLGLIPLYSYAYFSYYYLPAHLIEGNQYEGFYAPLNPKVKKAYPRLSLVVQKHQVYLDNKSRLDVPISRGTICLNDSGFTVQLGGGYNYCHPEDDDLPRVEFIAGADAILECRGCEEIGWPARWQNWSASK